MSITTTQVKPGGGFFSLPGDLGAHGGFVKTAGGHVLNKTDSGNQFAAGMIELATGQTNTFLRNLYVVTAHPLINDMRSYFPPKPGFKKP